MMGLSVSFLGYFPSTNWATFDRTLLFLWSVRFSFTPLRVAKNIQPKILKNSPNPSFGTLTLFPSKKFGNPDPQRSTFVCCLGAWQCLHIWISTKNALVDAAHVPMVAMVDWLLGWLPLIIYCFAGCFLFTMHPEKPPENWPTFFCFWAEQICGFCKPWELLAIVIFLCTSLPFFLPMFPPNFFACKYSLYFCYT